MVSLLPNLQFDGREKGRAYARSREATDQPARKPPSVIETECLGKAGSRSRRDPKPNKPSPITAFDLPPGLITRTHYRLCRKRKLLSLVGGLSLLSEDSGFQLGSRRSINAHMTRPARTNNDKNNHDIPNPHQQRVRFASRLSWGKS